MKLLFWAATAAIIMAFVQMEDDPVLGIRILAMVAVGIGLVVFLRSFWRASHRAQPGGPRPPVLVSARELFVGQTFTVAAPTSGRWTSLRAQLIFSERVEGRPVGGDRRRAVDRRDVVVRTATGTADQPLQFWIPEDAMHSFQSGHNELSWRLDVEMARRDRKLAGTIPLTVRPGVA